MVRVKYVTHEIDRHGKSRWYFRRRGRVKIALPDPDSPEFAAAYAEVLGGSRADKALIPKSARPGSVRHAVTLYYGGDEYARLRDGTRRNYRRVLERFCEQFGDLPIAQLGETQLQKLINGVAVKTPGAADHLLKRIRGVLRSARLHGLIQGNPRGERHLSNINGLVCPTTPAVSHDKSMGCWAMCPTFWPLTPESVAVC